MTAIERTAYPRFRRGLTAEELAAVYTPTPEETAFATVTARGEAAVLSLLVLLKAFQRLGYFPRPTEVPAAAVGHLRPASGWAWRCRRSPRSAHATGTTRRSGPISG